MKKILPWLAGLASASFLVIMIVYLIKCPAEPPPEWYGLNHSPANDIIIAQRESTIAAINHAFRVAAFALTWTIQLGYVAWLALRWQAQKRAERD